MHAHTHVAELYAVIAGFVSGGGIVRLAAYVSKALPPLPPNAGWWANFFYNLLKHATGIDPNSAKP